MARRPISGTSIKAPKQMVGAVPKRRVRRKSAAPTSGGGRATAGEPSKTGADGREPSRSPTSSATKPEPTQPQTEAHAAPQNAETGSLPRSWREAVPYIVWIVLVLGFGLEFVTAFVRFVADIIHGEPFTHGDALSSLISFVGMVGLAAMAIHWKQMRHWAATTSPNWVVAGFLLLLAFTAAIPLFEQGRWPIVVRVSLSESAATSSAPLSITSQAAPGGLPKTGPFMLDDGQRWQLVSRLRNIMQRIQPHAVCSVHPLALEAWGGTVNQEFLTLLGMANWDLESRMTPWTAPLPPGINLLVGEDHGLAFDCATRFAEILGNSGIATLHVRVNQVTSELAECKNQCIDMQIGAKEGH